MSTVEKEIKDSFRVEWKSGFKIVRLKFRGKVLKEVKEPGK